ncbi:DNA/RNA non-specific endonuclease [Komagataeibacter swingsii]|uniref:Endonuclease n=1 Tax=Komagataeibacter swingsii TaxID=215220 RepID=A0A2V4R533_9PROT|nr:DNA/RNA non-specific endonuclease [Komagataeibacter swingsii]PYD69873.1 endonuclease [Komagataeibacter swingsii]GBQ61116.1 endonuclease [Komagataeibacter swingsii DSM 16373]
MTRYVLPLLLGLARLLPTHGALAEGCAELGAGQQLPVLDNAKLSPRTQLLCNARYAVLYSGLAREPLWSAEHLDTAMVRAAMATPRRGEFHPDTRIAPDARAELEDYVRSGFDRGHMTPSGDMPDEQTQEETFLLSNIVPQHAVLNRGRWAEIESAVRRLALREGELYVVTGPAFHARTLSAIGTDRVLVPTSTWKAIYDPRHEQTGVYVCHNVARTPGCSHVSVAELTHMTGIDPFPALPARMKQACMTLPFGTTRRRTTTHRRRRARQASYRW